MSFTEWLKKNVTEARDALSAEVVRLKSRDFLEAVVASCAMVSIADGSVSSVEKQKMAGYLKRSEQLKVFDQNDVIRIFQKYIEKFEFDTAIGTGEVLQVLHRFRGKPQAQLLVRVCCAVGAADGDFSENERAVVRRICLELELDPSSFDL